MFRGKSAEHLLISELTKRGFTVSVPVVENKYDLIVDNGKRVQKVQVKSTTTKSGNSYQITVKTRAGDYSSADVDVFAFYVEPTETWYFVPFSLIKVKSVFLYPGQKKGNFDTYEGYWRVFDI